jgi:hypothetical protein
MLAIFNNSATIKEQKNFKIGDNRLFPKLITNLQWLSFYMHNLSNAQQRNSSFLKNQRLHSKEYNFTSYMYIICDLSLVKIWQLGLYLSESIYKNIDYNINI